MLYVRGTTPPPQCPMLMVARQSLSLRQIKDTDMGAARGRAQIHEPGHGLPASPGEYPNYDVASCRPYNRFDRSRRQSSNKSTRAASVHALPLTSEYNSCSFTVLSTSLFKSIEREESRSLGYSKVTQFTKLLPRYCIHPRARRGFVWEKFQALYPLTRWWPPLVLR